MQVKKKVDGARIPFECHQTLGHKKWASDLYRAAQPRTLAAFRPWGSSVGAGRIGLARVQKYKLSETYNTPFEKTCIWVQSKTIYLLSINY